MDLFIVESPNKVKKIQKILGGRFRVLASVGHVRDLPKHAIGVEPPDFRPQYEITEDKQAVVKRLRMAAKQCDAIYLGTDPDREGEAIAWHIAKVLGVNPKGDRVRRVRFQEISRNAIQEAVRNAGNIDFQRVAAQESRRVIDRLVGYLVSPALGRGMSAGRVQSPSVRLVVEREREIRDFRPKTYYEVVAKIDEPHPWSAYWYWKPFAEKEQAHFFDRSVCEQVAKTRRLTVLSVETGQRKRKPPAPFTTSSLQQTASARLHLSPEKTMSLAQNLFAAGAITYHRTDSPNLSEDALTEIRQWLTEHGYPVSEKPNRWRAKGGAQEAHEAIRPVDITIEDAGDSDEERALYRLIRNRALACQMPAAIYDVTRVTLEGDVAVPLKDNPPALFVAKGERLTAQKGWLALEADATEDTEGSAKNDTNTQLPDRLAQGDTFSCQCRVLDKQTQPPARYTEASLIKTLERLGIGRPSTYATILKTIKQRGYVEVKKRKLHATEKGEKLYESLKGRFRFFEYDYTAHMENLLDAVAEGKQRYSAIVKETYRQLTSELKAHFPDANVTSTAATGERPAAKSAGFDCPKCRRPIEDRGAFWRCTGCRKNLFKESYGHRFSREEAIELFSGGKLMLDLVSKKGKPYRGVLSLGRKGLQLSFPKE